MCHEDCFDFISDYLNGMSDVRKTIPDPQEIFMGLWLLKSIAY